MLCKALNCRVGLVGLVMVFYSPAVAAAGDLVELKLKFPPGRNQYVELSVESLQVVKASGSEMKITIKQITGVMEKVASSSKDGAKIVFSYDRRGMTIEHPMMGRLTYDSDMPSEDDAPYIKQICAPLIGMSTTMELNGSAKVTSFSGMDAILDKVAASAAGNPFLAQMEASLTDDAAKLSWGDNRWAILPDHPVKPGDTWNSRRENDVPQIGKLISDYSCKLERIVDSDGRKLAIIAFTGKITQSGEADDSTEVGAMGLKVTEGTLKGTAKFDIEAGQIIDQTRETQLTLATPSPDGGTPDMQIATTSKETLVVRSPAEREKAKRENQAKARAKKAEAKKAEAEKAESKKAKADSE